MKAISIKGKSTFGALMSEEIEQVQNVAKK